MQFFKITPAANLSKERSFAWKPSMCSLSYARNTDRVFHVGFSVAPSNTTAEHLRAMNVFHHKLVIICALDEKKMVIFCLVSPHLIFSSSVT